MCHLDIYFFNSWKPQKIILSNRSSFFSLIELELPVLWHSLKAVCHPVSFLKVSAVSAVLHEVTATSWSSFRWHCLIFLRWKNSDSDQSQNSLVIQVIGHSLIILIYSDCCYFQKNNISKCCACPSKLQPQYKFSPSDEISAICSWNTSVI